MSNLKVNSLTKSLEFKRKHNKLVDKVENGVSQRYDVTSETIRDLVGKVNTGDIINYQNTALVVYSVNDEGFYAISLIIDDGAVYEYFVTLEGIEQNQYTYASYDAMPEIMYAIQGDIFGTCYNSTTGQSESFDVYINYISKGDFTELDDISDFTDSAFILGNLYWGINLSDHTSTQLYLNPRTNEIFVNNKKITELEGGLIISVNLFTGVRVNRAL